MSEQASTPDVLSDAAFYATVKQRVRVSPQIGFSEVVLDRKVIGSFKGATAYLKPLNAPRKHVTFPSESAAIAAVVSAALRGFWTE